MPANGVINVVHIAFEVGKGTLPAEILHDLADGAAQAVFVDVIAAIDRIGIAFQVLGRDGRADEDEIVVKVGAMQDLGCHRIEEGFGEFRLLVVEQEPDVEQLDLLPGGIVEIFGIELVAQARHALIDAVVVKADPFLDGLVHAQPVTVFETRLGLAAGLAKQGVVLVEALNHGQGNLVRVGAVKADRNLHEGWKAKTAAILTPRASLSIVRMSLNHNVKSHFVD